jgi:hypothetical protein
MADIVNLQDRLKAKQDEDARYLERIDLTSRMIPVIGLHRKTLKGSVWKLRPVQGPTFAASDPG